MSVLLEASPSSSSDSFLLYYCLALANLFANVFTVSLAAFDWFLPTEELPCEWCTFLRVDSTLNEVSSPLSFLCY